MTDNTEAPLLPLPERSAAEKLRDRDEHYTKELARIGSAIGYGNAQAILGRLWDEMLHDTYGGLSGRGRMGVTVDDELPPIPKANAKRWRLRSNGAYEMVPAYDVAELKVFGHAAIAKDRAARVQPNSVSGDSVMPPLQPPGATLEPGARSQWISVDERLPELHTEVLIAFAESSLPATGQLDRKRRHPGEYEWLYPAENGNWHSDSDWTVTHWMELPEHPTWEPGASAKRSSEGEQP